MRSRPGLSLVILAAPLLAGCADALGPEAIPTAEVSGVVLMSGEPLGGGWVEFQPIDGAMGDVRSARINPDGSFRADRVPIGLTAIKLVNVPIKLPGAAQLFSHGSPIRRTIPAQSAEPIRIDVFQELLQYQRARRAAGGAS